MKFSGPDLLVSNFELNILVVSKNVFSESALEQAASRLLASWPMLSFRTSIMVGQSRHSKAKRLMCCNSEKPCD
jgi:hypothetical protein